MARNTTITDEQILEAASAVFLAEGFSAQTAKIAQRAGVSEGSIFKRFPTKEALFFAALQIENPPAWYAQLDAFAGNGNCQENLTTICFSLLDFFCRMFPRIITTLGSHVNPGSANPFAGLPEQPAIRDVNKLNQFLKQEVAAGRLRACDTELVAHLILGAVTNHVFPTMLSGQNLTQERMAEIARGTIDLIWNGIAPTSTQD